jgi:RNA polymerase sigma-32 factor
MPDRKHKKKPAKITAMKPPGKKHLGRSGAREPEVLTPGSVLVPEAVPGEEPGLEPGETAAPAEDEDLVAAAESGELHHSTPALYDPVTSYFQSIRHYPLLDREEEKAQAIRYLKKNDIEAAYSLVTGNLRLVVKIAMEYRRAWRDIMDLIGEGNVGLMQAVKKYDPYRGVRFSSYAAWWIRAYILRYIINNARMVKLGTTQAQRTLFYQMGRERERLRRMGIEPDSRALASALSVKESEVEEMAQRLSGVDLSLEAPRGEGEGTTLLDALPSPQTGVEELVGDKQARALYQDKLAIFVTSLTEREQRIFRARWMKEDQQTLQEVGEGLGITRERVRQIEARLLMRLRAFLEAEGLRAEDFFR